MDQQFYYGLNSQASSGNSQCIFLKFKNWFELAGNLCLIYGFTLFKTIFIEYQFMCETNKSKEQKQQQNSLL